MEQQHRVGILKEVSGAGRKKRWNTRPGINWSLRSICNSKRQLSSITGNGVNQQYWYDPFGRRVKTVDGNTTTITLYSGNDIVYEIKKVSNNPDVVTRYIVVNGRYLAWTTQVEAQQATYYYHTDAIGSVRALTNASGNVVAKFVYDAYGNVVSEEGSEAANERQRFTGKRWDAATGLYYFNARYYDPGIGRFISRDPAFDGLNWFVYARSNPLRYVDPTGLYIEINEITTRHKVDDMFDGNRLTQEQWREFKDMQGETAQRGRHRNLYMTLVTLPVHWSLSGITLLHEFDRVELRETWTDFVEPRIRGDEAKPFQLIEILPALEEGSTYYIAFPDGRWRIGEAEFNWLSSYAEDMRLERRVAFE